MDDGARLKTLIGELADAFPRNGATVETGRLYVRELADLPIDALERAVRVLMRSSEFFPTLRAIREAVAEMTLELPGEAEALSQIEARLAWGRGTPDGDPPPVHPLVREALDHVGGFHAWKQTSEPGILRSQFLRLFRELRASQVRDVQVGRELAPGPRRPELTA